MTMTHTAGIHLGLERISLLLEALHNPQDDLKFIHIAGTNGKGSVLAFTSTILKVAGLNVGTFFSPAMNDPLETIQVNHEPISRQAFDQLTMRISEAILNHPTLKESPPTLFEIETVMAFLYFKEMNCDIVVLETGMGGSTDATNVIRNTLVAVVTSVGRDHMDFLGEEVSARAEAKAGIIKPGSRAIVGNLNGEAHAQIVAKADLENCKWESIQPGRIKNVQINHENFIQSFDYGDFENVKISLLGDHQIQNACLAIHVISALNESGFNIASSDIYTGLKLTRWFGRMTVVSQNPALLVDGAHNVDAVRALVASLENLFKGKRIIGVMGVYQDKEVAEMIDATRRVMAEIHAVPTGNPRRGLAPEKLADLIEAAGIKSTSHESVEAGLAVAIEEAKAHDGIVVCFGSLSYLGKVRDFF